MFLLVERHRIAEIVFAIGNSSAVKTDIFRVCYQFFDSVKFFLARQYAEMALVIAFTHMLSHYFLLSRNDFIFIVLTMQ